MLGSALLTLALLGASPVQAQTSMPNEVTPRATAVHGSVVDTRLVKAHALNPTMMSQIQDLDRITEKAFSLLAIDKLVEGSSEAAIKMVAMTSLIEEHTVNVKVNYDHRPIGGILNVQVSMTPSFRGIGVATRPTVSKSIAQAIDQLEEGVVRELVKDLTKEIKAEFARYEETKADPVKTD